jgi:hypothetical protein
LDKDILSGARSHPHVPHHCPIFRAHGAHTAGKTVAEKPDRSNVVVTTARDQRRSTKAIGDTGQRLTFGRQREGLCNLAFLPCEALLQNNGIGKYGATNSTKVECLWAREKEENGLAGDTF